VHGYLRDFLFTAERARSPVRALSGGERNRLLLARLFTRPSNVLVMDEPTNDLDLETLELLEQQLVEWPGTLLLVSHDRVFLDHVVTSTLVFEGAGRVQEFVGGYEDWLRQKSAATRTAKAEQSGARTSAGRSAPARSSSKKLSFKDQRELDAMPARIEAMESEQRELAARVAGPAFYKEGADAIRQSLARQEELRRELEAIYERWHALESKR
jgi:ATP-binding cassette subfamily F protein uup